MRRSVFNKKAGFVSALFLGTAAVLPLPGLPVAHAATVQTQVQWTAEKLDEALDLAVVYNGGETLVKPVVEFVRNNPALGAQALRGLQKVLDNSDPTDWEETLKAIAAIGQLPQHKEAAGEAMKKPFSSLQTLLLSKNLSRRYIAEKLIGRVGIDMPAYAVEAAHALIPLLADKDLSENGLAARSLHNLYAISAETGNEEVAEIVVSALRPMLNQFTGTAISKKAIGMFCNIAASYESLAADGLKALKLLLSEDNLMRDHEDAQKILIGLRQFAVHPALTVGVLETLETLAFDESAPVVAAARWNALEQMVAVAKLQPKYTGWAVAALKRYAAAEKEEALKVAYKISDIAYDNNEYLPDALKAFKPFLATADRGPGAATELLDLAQRLPGFTPQVLAELKPLAATDSGIFTSRVPTRLAELSREQPEQAQEILYILEANLAYISEGDSIAYIAETIDRVRQNLRLSCHAPAPAPPSLKSPG